MALIRISRISFTTADADRLGSFYRQAFGFEAMETEHHGGTSFARLTGVEGAQARALPLRLGEETIELLEFTQRGAPYPADIGCDDPQFQHIAIVVADMETAYLRLCECEGLDRDHETGTATTARGFGSCHRVQVSRSGGASARTARVPARQRAAALAGGAASARSMPRDRSFRHRGFRHGAKHRVLPAGPGIFRRRGLAQSRPGAGTA